MILRELLRSAAVLGVRGDLGRDIRSLAYDSRQTQPDCLFFAIQGEHADGHQFIQQVLEKGAAGIVSERAAPVDFAAIWVQVPNIRKALSEISRTFYAHPESKLKLVGITGTNGKTTTAYLVRSILEAAGIKTGLLGTIEYSLGDRTIPALHTTPESLDLAGYLAELVQAGGQAAVMEVSSHALAQGRTCGFPFQAAVFTNLDDPWGRRLLELNQPRQITYGIASDAQVTTKHSSFGPDGIRAMLSTPEGKLEIESPLLGRANLENILAAVAAAEGMGVSKEAIQKGIAAVRQVPGRFERVDEGQPFTVLVDYAHTHDALQNALKTARELTRNQLIVLFGCGGDRDRTKRPLMGEVAGHLSDSVVLTSDNPRSEDPILIMNDVMVGLQKSGKPYIAEVDREVAIRKALAQAHEGDLVLLAGKGHETYQVLKDRSIPFDDREIARRILREMGFRRA